MPISSLLVRVFQLVLLIALPAIASAQGSFVNFESGHVRPLALSCLLYTSDAADEL